MKKCIRQQKLRRKNYSFTLWREEPKKTNYNPLNHFPFSSKSFLKLKEGILKNKPHKQRYEKIFFKNPLKKELIIFLKYGIYAIQLEQ